MRRILLTLLCVCPLLARAGNTLTLSSASGHPGDVVTIEASMSGAEEVVACEWRIPLGRHLTYVPNSVELSATRSDGHSITAASYQDTLIVSIYSVAMKPLLGTEGVLFSFRVTMGNEPATYTLTPEVLLSSEEGAAVATTIQSGETTILSPKISILTSQVDFGHIPIRATYNRTLQVQNVGNEDLHITDVLISAAALILPQSTWTIAPGQTQNITLTYNPIVRGAISETIRFRSDAINDADVYQANKVAVVADPFSVNELHVVGASGIADEEVTISLTVNNMEPLVGLQCSFVLPTALEYVENSVAVSTRSAGHVAASTLDGNKLTLMLYSLLNDTIKDHDGEVLTFRLRLNGTSGNYSLNPTEVFLSNIAMENMTSAVYSASVHINSPRLNAPTSIHFGNSSVMEKVTAQYTIRNQGNATLTVERIAFLAEGFEVEEALPLQIAQNKTQTITVAYTPTVEGDYSTTMQVYSNDPTNRMHSVTLSGHIYEPNELTVQGEQMNDDSYRIHISLANYTPIVGLQMDFLSVGGVTPTFVPSARLSNHSSMMMPLGEDKYRIIVYSLSNTAIEDNEGSLFDIVYAANDKAATHGQQVSIDSVYLSDIENVQRLTASSASHTIAYNYTITWQNEDGSLLDEVVMEYGEVPTHTDIVKANTAEYTYTFAGWTPEVIAVTGDATYKATFNATKNSYTITWQNADESLIDETTVEYGVVPTHADPVKANTAEYTYTFAGWTPEVVAVTGEATYKAIFNATKNSYTITWQNEDGSLIDQTTVEYGVVPTHANPTKEATAEYTYTFAGWTPEIVAVTGDATYKAIFNATKNSYTITWLNDDDSMIDETTVEYGIVPTHANPTKEATAEYTYTFAGWAPEIVAVTGDATYKATYSAVRLYTITWLNEDGSLIDETVVAENQIPMHTTPTKEATAEYTYTFAGWTPEVAAVTGEATYKATFNATKNSYTITWLNDDDSMIDETVVEYGVVPTHADPTKNATAEYTYTFAGWTPEVVAVTGDATYKATYESNARMYTVTANAENGEVEGSGEYAYGTVLVLTVTPNEGYIFSKWSDGSTVNPRTIEVTGDVAYTAVCIDESLGNYLTFISHKDGSTIGLAKLSNYQTIEYSEDGITWKKMTTSTKITLNNGVSVYMRGKLISNNTILNYTQFKMSGSIEAKGVLNSLWNYENLNASLKSYCGYNLFNGCTALTSAPELPSNTLTASCYRQMFYQCSHLNYIKCLATNISASNCTQGWVNGVASSGTFVKSKSMNSWTTGNNGIPTGWTAYNDKYTITFLNYDDTELQSGDVAYGELPQYVGDTPVRMEDDAYTYTFAGWTPEVVTVTDDATYKATFNATKNSYTITWLNDDNSLIDQTTVECGVVPTHADPVKANTTEYTYTFAGWTPEVVAVTGEATYKAIFNATKNSYTITWDAVNGEVEGAGEYVYGTEIELTAIPDAGYVFYQWSDGDMTNPRTIIVTENAEYTAVFISDIGTGVENGKTSAPVIKILRDNHIFILRGEKVYTLQGQEVK